MKNYAFEKFTRMTKAFMVKGAKFCGKYDIPECPCTIENTPKDLIAYSDIKAETNYEAFAHFYIDDYKFNSVWTHPQKALEKFKRCAGVITPDFSTYQDMPKVFKIFNTYRMRAVGYWLSKLGIPVINNVRWGTSESYDYCFDGIPKNSIVSIGTVGCIKEKCNWQRFSEGLAELVQRLTPKTILVYGSAQDKFFGKYRQSGIKIVEYPSRMSLVFEKRCCNE